MGQPILPVQKSLLPPIPSYHWSVVLPLMRACCLGLWLREQRADPRSSSTSDTRTPPARTPLDPNSCALVQRVAAFLRTFTVAIRANFVESCAQSDYAIYARTIRKPSAVFPSVPLWVPVTNLRDVVSCNVNSTGWCFMLGVVARDAFTLPILESRLE